MRALAAQERQATRTRQRGDVNTGPKDDLDIEWEQLMEAHHQAGYCAPSTSPHQQCRLSLPVFCVSKLVCATWLLCRLSVVVCHQLGGTAFLMKNTYVCTVRHHFSTRG